MGWEDRANALSATQSDQSVSSSNWEKRADALSGGIGLSGPGSKDDSPSSVVSTDQPSSIPSYAANAGKDIASGFVSGVKGIGSGISNAYSQLNDVVNRPVDTLGDQRFRNEALRGVNDVVMPYVGNRIVEAIGGSPRESESDKSAFPNAQSFGSAIGMAVPVPFGEIAGLAKQGIKSAANKAMGREIERGAVAFGEGAGKRIKTKLEAKEGEPIRNVLRAEPELLDAAHKADPVKAQAAQTVLEKGMADAKKIYSEQDIAHGRQPVASGTLAKAEALEMQAQNITKQGAVYDAGSTERLAADREVADIYKESQKLRNEAAKKISDSRTRGIRSHDPLPEWDSRISELKSSAIESERKAGKVLDELKDSYKSKFSDPNEIVPTTTLRAVQSDYQLTGYGRPQPGDVQASANLLAHQEASKIIGNSVMEHVTGLNYRDAIEMAEKDPNSVAGRLMAANEKISVANNVLAGIEARKGGNVGAPYRASNLVHSAMNGAHALGAVATHGATLPLSIAMHVAPHVPRAADHAVIALSKINGPSNKAVNLGAKVIQGSSVGQ